MRIFLIVLLALALLGGAYVLLRESAPPPQEETAPVSLDERAAALGERPQEASTPSAQPVAPSAPRIAEVKGTLGHAASGTARIIREGDKTYLEYQNLRSTDGPDLFVHLSKGKNDADSVNLGRVTSLEGTVRYEVPPGTDLSLYRYAITWCEAYSVLFNYAELL